MKSSKSQLDIHYEACPKKLEARNQTIIQSYRNIFHKKSIPANKQYWAICGRCSYKKGKLAENCEPDQLIKEKLIKSNQFHGVEICPEIYEANKNSNKQIHWYLGDFYESMVEYSNHNKFKPAIVNVDMLLMPKCGAEYLSKIMHFLTPIKNIMIVGNFIIKTRQHVATIEDMMKRLEKEPCFQSSMSSDNWKIKRQYYLYNGTGKTRTKMGTIILYKEVKRGGRYKDVDGN